MQNLLEFYRPKTLKEFIPSKDLDKKIEKIKETIKQNGTVILSGNAGIGKTTLSNIMANELGYTIIETNASNERKKENLEQILRQVQLGTFMPTLYLFDEVDGLNWSSSIISIMQKIIQKTVHPIIMTANNLRKIPQTIQKQCTMIKLYSPNLTDVAQRIREIAEKEGIKPQYGNISSDVRNTILKTFYGGEVYQKEDKFTKIKQIFMKQTKNITKDEMIWIAGNISNFYTGRQLIETVELVADADVYGLALMRELDKSRFGVVRYPYFLKRASLVKHS